MLNTIIFVDTRFIRLNFAEECGPGTFARKRKMKPSKKRPDIIVERITLKPYCRSCPVGRYQPMHGKLGCFKCPNGYTTNGVGSVSIQECVPTIQHTCTNASDICNKGQCVIVNDVYYSCECNKYYVGNVVETVSIELMWNFWGLQEPIAKPNWTVVL